MDLSCQLDGYLRTTEEQQALNKLSTYDINFSLSDQPSVHKKVALRKVDTVERAIEGRYNVGLIGFFFKKCDFKTKQRLIAITVHQLDVRKCLEELVYYTAGGAFAGGVIGGIAGAGVSLCTYNPGHIVTGIEAGVFGGAAIGLTLSVKSVVNRCITTTQTAMNLHFVNWKSGLDKEKYDLFLNLLKNYDGEELFIDQEVIKCPITLKKPGTPVISPNGHIYEKKAIEDWLELKWGLVRKAENDKYSENPEEDRVKKELKVKELKQLVCPMREVPFEIKDLREVRKKLDSSGKIVVAFQVPKRCHFGLDIPTIPVGGIDDKVYDMEEIEQILGEVEKKSAELQRSGLTGEELNKEVDKLFPGGKRFKKEDLVYDGEFVKDLIARMKKIRIKLESDPDKDVVLLNILANVLESYKRTYREIKEEVITKLYRDLFSNGATVELCSQVINEFRKHYENAKQKQD